MRRSQFVFLLALLSLLPLSGACGEKPGEMPILNAEDILALMDASYAKVRIIGNAGEEISLSVVDASDKSVGQLHTLLLGPSGSGTFCILAKNSEGITGGNPIMNFAFTWESLPLVQKGRLKVRKSWKFQKGATFTDGYTEESFNSPQIVWNIEKNDMCEITRIWWSGKKIAPIDASGNVEKVGAVVLRRARIQAEAK